MGELHDRIMRKLENGEIKTVKTENIYQKTWETEIMCSECGTWNEKGNNYCLECGHKLKKIDNINIDSRYCTICGEKVSIDSYYCSQYGHRIELKTPTRKCDVCGEWIDEERYCIHCGHDTIKRSPLAFKNKNLIDLKKEKICPNCNHEYQRYYNYCHWCGEKLIRK